jgi:mono/diheme cytochrome c family protein
VFTQVLWSLPDGVVLGPAVATAPRVDAGELLLGELNCVACHQASDAIKARLAPRQAPRLGEAGSRITPQHLRAWLNDPPTEKPGTPMPDLLHGLGGREKFDAAEALTHFLVSLNPPDAAEAPVGVDQSKIHLGRRLYHEVGCVACHAPQESVAALRSAAASAEAEEELKRQQAELDKLADVSVPLGNLARKFTVSELARFLADPLKVRPSGRMPSLNLTEAEATAIAMYLLRDQAPATLNPSLATQRLPGVRYEYFEDPFSADAPDFDKLTPVTTGVLDRFDLAPRRRDHSFGFRFTGFLKVPAAGRYTFYCASDDGSRLSVGERLVVQNDGHHPFQESKGAIELKAGEQPIAVTYFQGGAQFGLKVSYEGPDLKKQEIPAAALSHLGQPMVPLGEENFVVDLDKAERGKGLFSSLGCAACHESSRREKVQAATLNAKPLLEIDLKRPGGCLDPQPSKGAPRFRLNASQREALRAALAAVTKLAEPLGAKAQVTRTLTALNCLACHTREGAGGPAPGRSDFFSVVGDADLGEEGRIPPHLNGVGAKLRSDWLREVLVNRGAVRPYMATRMPQFGEANVGLLLGLFEQADGPVPSDAPEPYSERTAKLGRRLVGRDGLVCISCHSFDRFKSLGIPAMDLTQMTRRLRKAWFCAYLIDPQLLRPGTRMPTFFPDGQAVNKDILDGDTQKQIDAIWTFLSKGPEADLPHGLVQAKMELVADKEPIIYRNFIQGAGVRAIGVGYPEKANLAFDAQALRLALVWHGAFLDAAIHRQDRGAGFAPPLGDHLLQLPAGPPFALLADPSAPWPTVAGKKAGYQMRGYRLDQQMRPVFLYSFGGVQVEDYPIAQPGDLDPQFLRTLTLRAEQPVSNLWFRAAVGSKIDTSSPDTFVVNGRLNLTFKLAAGAKALVRQSNGQSELLVPVVFNGNEAKFAVEMIW